MHDYFSSPNQPFIEELQGETTLSNYTREIRVDHLRKTVAALTVLIRWLVGSQWGIARVIFTIARYTSFPALALTLVDMIGTCSSGRAATDVLYPVCIASTEVLLAFRVWASWNRSRKVLIILCGSAVVLPAGMAAACVYLGSELPNASAQSMYLGGKLNCALDLPLRVAVEYGFLMGYELICSAVNIAQIMTATVRGMRRKLRKPCT
ncbi:hypothetical protein CONPUDRAFT_72247 [Coniophora puteana RWD-64-598 SS2]|uniref:Uncharacterized protein n=1 Tax=Coniophora puteana (strain RWD-64-598) TaxID=741705 RepID=A0A5M3MRU3_CONPW|nr:uncharacterized protein CONPUDRAFT_72247 [Coniophora puteana RWD-64-598 SS2]EIW81872.1 hypothetical protein CONPUDRAFT_72247 [Coniophora puteana RWD-64-598 SS2]